MMNNSNGTCVCTCTSSNTRFHPWILEFSVRFPKHFGIDLPVLLRLHHYNVNFWLSSRYTSAHLACFLRRHGNRIFIVRGPCVLRTSGTWKLGGGASVRGVLAAKVLDIVNLYALSISRPGLIKIQCSYWASNVTGLRVQSRVDVLVTSKYELRPWLLPSTMVVTISIKHPEDGISAFEDN